MTTTESATGLHCSFCGKHQDLVSKLIAGPGVYICDECVDLCQEIIAETLPTEDVRRRIAPRRPTFPASWTTSMTWAWASCWTCWCGSTGPTRASIAPSRGSWTCCAGGKCRGRASAMALGMTRQSAWERFSGEE